MASIDFGLHIKVSTGQSNILNFGARNKPFQSGTGIQSEKNTEKREKQLISKLLKQTAHIQGMMTAA